MKFKGYFFICAILLGIACKHTILHEDEDDIIDEILPDCDPTVIHFNNDIQPFITSSCAIQGCHDSQTPAGFVDLSNYDAIMRSTVLGEPIVIPGKPNQSSLYRAVKLLDILELVIMPPPANYQITNAKKELIGQWIKQGALNLEPCVDATCDTTQFTWSKTIRPIITTYCTGCHYSNYPAAGINIENHGHVIKMIENGQFVQSITGTEGVRLMPLDKPMPKCKRTQIKKWVANGAPKD